MRISLVTRLLRAGALAVGLFGPAATLADVPEQVLRELGLHQLSGRTEREIAGLQTDLTWLGLFQDVIDGQYDRSTRDAIGIFLEGMNKPARTSLSDSDRAILRSRAADTIRAAGFRKMDFEWTGMSVRLPGNFLRRPEVFGRDYTHVSMSGRGSAGITVQLFRYDVTDAAGLAIWLRDLADLYEQNAEDFYEVNRGTVGRTAFLTHEKDDRIQHDIYETDGNQIRGIAISYDATSRYAVQPILSEIFNSLNLFAGNAVPVSQIQSRLRSGDYPGGRDYPDWYRTMISSGSGSIVSTAGHILTNHHVVAGCGRLTVNGQEATLLGADIRVDLALVRAPAFANRSPVKFRSDSAVLGEPIYVMGFPVFDVSQSINITNGIVSSTVGLLGDRTYVQITAPVQPGNSGGPVIDPNGAQVAVVVSKPGATFGSERNIENIAWVIRSSEAITFMRRFGVFPITTTRVDSSFAPAQGRVAEWRQQTVRLECHTD